MVFHNKFMKALRNIILIILAVLTVNFAVTKLIYDACFSRQNSTSAIASDRNTADINSEKLTFLSGENTLQGYYFPADSSDTLIVLSPGFTATSYDYIEVIASLLGCGYSVFSYDPTGSGESGGSSCVGFSQELLDLEAALDFVARSGLFGCRHTVLFGHSRGGYASLCVSGFGFTPDAVISVSGLDSAMDGIMNMSESKIGALAYLNYPTLWLYQTVLFGKEVTDISADKVLSETKIPALIVHGEDDDRVPYYRYSAYSYKDSTDSDAAEFLLISGKGHTDILYDENGRADASLMNAVDSFIKKALR